MARDEFRPYIPQPFPILKWRGLRPAPPSVQEKKQAVIECMIRKHASSVGTQIEEAAKKTGVSQQAIKDWIEDPDFKKALLGARRQALHSPPKSCRRDDRQRAAQWAEPIETYESREEFVARIVVKTEELAGRFYDEQTRKGLLPQTRDRRWLDLWQGGWSTARIRENDTDGPQFTEQAIKKAIKKEAKEHNITLRGGSRGPHSKASQPSSSPHRN
jgi:transposase